MLLIDIPGAVFLFDGDPDDAAEYGDPEVYICPLTGDEYAYEVMLDMTARLATMANDVQRTTYTTRDSHGHVDVTHVMRYRYSRTGKTLATVRHYPSRITITIE